MAKKIKMNDEEIERLVEEIRKELTKAKSATGKMSLTKDLSTVNEKAEIYFEMKAWLKMQVLIQSWDKEIAWHGICQKDPDANVYIVSDIVVYPQTVTGTTVEMDEAEYATWIMENVEDERFNNIRMQGHSHVNMGTTPSATDLQHQEDILSMLGKDGYYVFVIWNKKGDHTCKIYDLEKNILFEDSDISVSYEGKKELEEFREEAKRLVKTKTYTPPAKKPETKKDTEDKSVAASISAYAGYGVDDYDDEFDEFYGRHAYAARWFDQF